MVNQKAYALGANRSCIRDLFEYGRRQAAIVGSENVYDYSWATPSIPAPPEVNEAVRAILDDTDSLLVHGYTSAVGGEARRAISDDLNARCGAAASRRNSSWAAAPRRSWSACSGLWRCPEAKLLTVAPYFPEYKPFAEEAGLIFKGVAPDVPDFQINREALTAMLTPNTQAVLLNSPNNPSGVVYTRQTLEALAAILRKKAAAFGHPIYLISDEPYRELVYGVEVPYLPAIYPDTIICYSYSKSLSLPGERIGYVLVPGSCADSQAVYAAVAGAARSCGHVCAPSLWQKVIARCAHLRPDLVSYDRNRQALYQGLTAMGYKMAKPDGAFYLFIQAPGGDANKFSDLAKKENLLLVPGDGFGCPGYFRICYCVSYDMIQRSLPAFEKLIRQFQ